jgi:hypothetical protein
MLMMASGGTGNGTNMAIPTGEEWSENITA